MTAAIKLGHHPSNLKTAHAIVLKKPSNDHTTPRAYRLIALLNTLARAFESVIALEITYVAEEHRILSVTQMGGRCGRSMAALDLLAEQAHTATHRCRRSS